MTLITLANPVRWNEMRVERRVISWDKLFLYKITFDYINDLPEEFS